MFGEGVIDLLGGAALSAVEGRAEQYLNCNAAHVRGVEGRLVGEREREREGGGVEKGWRRAR